MKLFRVMVIAGLTVSALILAGCAQAEAPAEEKFNPVVIEDFEGFADTAAIETGWILGYKNNAETGIRTLETTSPLVGTKSLKLQYQATALYGITDFAAVQPDGTFITKAFDTYNAKATGIQLTIKPSAFDNISLYIRNTGNNNLFQATIISGDGFPDFTIGESQVIKVPFTAFTKPSWSPAHTVASLRAALAGKTGINELTIEPEVDDTTTLTLTAARTLVVDNISYY